MRYEAVAHIHITYNPRGRVQLICTTQAGLTRDDVISDTDHILMDDSEMQNPIHLLEDSD